jgi:hypothetical protein
MNGDLLVSFRAGNHQEVWIEHPELTRMIHECERGTASFDRVITVAETLAGVVGVDGDLELDEIHDGEGKYSIELWDYNDGARMVERVEMPCLEYLG